MGQPPPRAGIAASWSRTKGATRQTTSRAAMASPPTKRSRRLRVASPNRIGAANKPATANATPPTKAELSKPATTSKAIVTTNAKLGCKA